MDSGPNSCSLSIEITTADLEGFRDTWTDGPVAKKKKQERLIGFFYYNLRLGWIKSNPAILLVGSGQMVLRRITSLHPREHSRCRT
jgi:hypothetical protein